MTETNESAIETEADVSPETTPEIEVVPDPIDDLYHGECPSISGRSSLTYALGRHQEGVGRGRAVAGDGRIEFGVLAAVWAGFLVAGAIWVAMRYPFIGVGMVGKKAGWRCDAVRPHTGAGAVRRGGRVCVRMRFITLRYCLNRPPVL